MESKIFNRLTLAALFVAVINTGCHGSSGGDPGSQVAANGTITLSPITVAVGGSAPVQPTGGTGSYNFSVSSLGGGTCGTVSPPTGTFAASGIFYAGNSPCTASLQVTDSGGNSAFAMVTVGSGLGGGLTVTPASPTVAVNGTDAVTVTGGNGQYTYQVTSGGGYFIGNVYYAPSTAQSVTITVHDSGTPQLSGTATITVGGSSGGGSCTGTFQMTLSDPYTFSQCGTGSATLTIGAVDQNGTITGTIAINNQYCGASSISGSCSGGNIQFNNTPLPGVSFPFTGTYSTTGGGQTVMFGTYKTNGNTYNWSAHN